MTNFIVIIGTKHHCKSFEVIFDFLLLVIKGLVKGLKIDDRFFFVCESKWPIL